jgi:hypothetical protein
MLEELGLPTSVAYIFSNELHFFTGMVQCKSATKLVKTKCEIAESIGINDLVPNG